MTFAEIKEFTFAKKPSRVSLHDGLIVINVKSNNSIEKRIEIINNVLNLCLQVGNDKYFNPIKVSVVTDIELVKAYTDIEFSEEDFEDIYMLYDTIKDTGILTAAKTRIDEKELDQLMNWIRLSIEKIETFNNSAMGILTSISKDKEDSILDVENILAKVKDPEIQNFVKTVMGNMV